MKKSLKGLCVFFFMLLFSCTVMAQSALYPDPVPYPSVTYLPTISFCPPSNDGTHAWTDWVMEREPSCTADGIHTRECLLCGFHQTEILSRTGHSYGAWQTVREATCVSYGERIRTCMRCGAAETDYLSLAPHSFGAWQIITEATDHSFGTRGHTCAVCGYFEQQIYDPEGTLRIYSSGEEVRALQKLLLENGYYPGSVDGSFGPLTEQALKQFEAAIGLSEDGVAWPLVQEKLRHVFGDWVTIKEADAFSAGSRERVCEVCGFTESQEILPEGLLRRGDRGESVKALQEMLNAAGYDCGSPDGVFGGKTEQAVKAFEEAHGLAPDGLAWPGLLDMLKNPFAGNIRLFSGSIYRSGTGLSENIYVHMAVSATGPMDLNVWLRSLTDKEETPALDAFDEWPGGEDGSVFLEKGKSGSFVYIIHPTEADLKAGEIVRTVIAEGIDPLTEKGYVDETIVNVPLGTDEEKPTLHIEGYGETGHPEGGYVYREGDKIQITVGAKNIGPSSLRNVHFEGELRADDGTCLEKLSLKGQVPGTVTGPGGGVLDTLERTISAEDASRGSLHFVFFAEGEKMGEPEDPVLSYNSWVWDMRLEPSPEDDGGSGNSENVEADDGGTLIVTVEPVGEPADPEGYIPGETVHVSIRVTSTHTAYGVKDIRVMDNYGGEAPEFVGTIDLSPGESKTLPYDYTVTEEDLSYGEATNQAYVRVDLYEDEHGVTRGAYTILSEWIAVPVTDKKSSSQAESGFEGADAPPFTSAMEEDEPEETSAQFKRQPEVLSRAEGVRYEYAQEALRRYIERFIRRLFLRDDRIR